MQWGGADNRDAPEHERKGNEFHDEILASPILDDVDNEEDDRESRRRLRRERRNKREQTHERHRYHNDEEEDDSVITPIENI